MGILLLLVGSLTSLELLELYQSIPYPEVEIGGADESTPSGGMLVGSFLLLRRYQGGSL